MKKQLEKHWETMRSEDQTKFKRYAVLTGLALLLGIVYYMSGKADDTRPKKPKESEYEATDALLQQDIQAAVKEEVGKTLKDIEQTTDLKNEKQQRAVKDMVSEFLSANGGQMTVDGTYRGPMPTEEQASAGATQPYPVPTHPAPPPNYNGLENTYPNPISDAPEYINSGAVLETRIIGEIGHVEGASFQTQENKSAKKRKILLPVSFMKAKLLTGISAQTNELGEGNPEVIVFRVQAPAVLPNSLKANLKGCWVVANAFGNLAEERVQVRTVSLNCMSLDGKSVIDQGIKGFVVDSDGQRDMSGIVVHKAGAHMARAVVADLIGGLGEGVTQQSQTTSISPLGTTQVVDPDKAFQSGLGKGFSRGTTEMQKYFLDLAKQTTPVIEVGATKDVTVFIQEAVELEIKTYEDE